MREVVARAARAGMVGLAALVALSAAAGCGTGGKAAAPKPSPTRTRAAAPAFAAGGACQLLDYEAIRQAIGVIFSVAAAAQQGDTYTCVVQQRGVSLPDLTLSVTGTSSDEKVFQSVVMPKDATALTGLGKAAYSLQQAPVAPAGGTVEVGWLTGNRRLMVLRLRLAPTAPTADATTLGPKLVELAKSIDFTSS